MQTLFDIIRIAKVGYDCYNRPEGGDGMRLLTLIENTACREDLHAEHGLSLYIEACGRRILFDMGQSGGFAGNAAVLGVDLGQVDLAVVSHGHYDHGGGMLRFAQLNPNAPIYLHEDALQPHYNALGKSIGLDPGLAELSSVVFTQGTTELSQGLTLVTGSWSIEDAPGAHGMWVQRDGERVRDDFSHEQYLLIREGGKTVCVSGCSHRGVEKILDAFRPDVFIGGFHFMKLDPVGGGREILTRAARKLLASDTEFYTCHCTGREQFAFLKNILGDRLHALSGGIEIQIL